jgi:hypothetical protein
MMKKIALLSAAFVLVSAVAARADIVILRDGRSYSGTLRTEPNGKLAFKDNQGIQYSFPVTQIQSLVFSNLADHIALRSGDSYSGQLLGAATIHFRGANGIGYVFPLKDVSSIVFTHDAASAPASASGGNGMNVAPAPQNGTPGFHPASETPSIVISSGTPVSVRTDEAIDSNVDQTGKIYSARIAQDVIDSTGNVAIPAGTPAQLHIANLGSDAAHPDLALDLYSIDLNGREYKVDTSSVTENGNAGYGLNKRTAEYAGGGAGLGALLGAVFGGGRGAGIGTLAGGAAGALTQYFTRGKQVKVPAESTLNFQLQRTLVLHP